MRMHFARVFEVNDVCARPFIAVHGAVLVIWEKAIDIGPGARVYSVLPV